MKIPFPSALAVGTQLFLVIWTALALPDAAQGAGREAKVVIYDPDPAHLWNRMHAALFVRITDDGQTFGVDDVDPFLWPSSTYLLTEPRHGQVLALLNEFLETQGEKLISEPLKRALLQHDLWTIFDWLADSDAEFVEKKSRLIAQRRALRNRLAPIIKRLALTDEQIASLPDNYQITLSSEGYPRKQDPAHREKAYLPPDLFDAKGPWVHFQTEGGKPYPFGKPTALTHVFFAGARSTFFVFMNLPGGRQATLDYMQKVNRTPNPAGARERGLPLLTSNSGPLPPPEGTQLALVRQMMLINNEGKMRVTPVIQSVQFRVIHGKTEKENDCYELALQRKALFAGKGLRVSKSNEEPIAVFNVRDEDILDLPRPIRQMREAAVNQRRRAPATDNLRDSCAACHQRQGILSVNSFFHDKSPELTAAERGPEVDRVIRWKSEKFNWGLLEGLVAAPGPGK